MPTSEDLKAKWARLSLAAALLSTVAASTAILLADRAPVRLLVLWLGCFPALWLALRIIGAIAWDTSFKATSRLKIPAAPAQVFIAELASLLAMLVVHGIASWAWALEGVGVAIALAWLFYTAAAIAVSFVVYLPALLVAKALVRHAT